MNGTSASGGSVHALQRQNRTVITATKAGTEKNATVFARYWIEALRDPAADTDKNEVITALEAFKFAERRRSSFTKRTSGSRPSIRCWTAEKAGPVNAGPIRPPAHRLDAEGGERSRETRTADQTGGTGRRDRSC